MIIIPDVHGRTFWKRTVERRKAGEDVVFLGDYLDPNTYEFDEIVTNESAIANFKQIIGYAKTHPKTYLLLGNHDTSYLCGTQKCRYDYFNAAEIKSLFKSNADMFSLCMNRNYGNRTFLFSHTCITMGWLKSIGYDYLDIEDLVCFINSLVANAPDFLSYIGCSRYGECTFGSCVWADMSEIHDNELPGVYQIFGHTQSDGPVIKEGFAMLDCRCGFRLNENTLEFESMKD